MKINNDKLVIVKEKIKIKSFCIILKTNITSSTDKKEYTHEHQIKLQNI